jgi:DNA-binding transcriptional regulator YiaG
MTRRDRDRVRKGIDEMLRRSAQTPIPTSPRGLPRWKYQEMLPEGLYTPPRRPRHRGTDNPMTPATDPAVAATDEFTDLDIIAIRHTLHATQRRFAEMFGISVATLRNWEQGRRRPQGPARALLRVARANPDLVARTLWRFRRAWWLD